MGVSNAISLFLLAETDYYEAVGELHFEPGSMQGDLECVDVLLNDDCVKELNESFTFAICPIRDEDVYVEQFLSKVTIVDDDSKSFLLV